MARFTHPAFGGELGLGDINTFYASYYSTLTQKVSVIDEIKAVTYNEIDFQKGITIQNNSEITMQYAGKYNIAFSFEFLNAGGGGAGEVVNIWLRKNNVDVPWSNGKVVVNTNDKELIVAWNYFVEADAGDQWQIMWSPNNAKIEMVRFLEDTVKNHPAIPSAILTINQVG